MYTPSESGNNYHSMEFLYTYQLSVVRVENTAHFDFSAFQLNCKTKLCRAHPPSQL
jgi:hypothetical protein